MRLRGLAVAVAALAAAALAAGAVTFLAGDRDGDLASPDVERLAADIVAAAAATERPDPVLPGFGRVVTRRYRCAIASISTRRPCGRWETSTVERAGGSGPTWRA